MTKPKHAFIGVWTHEDVETQCLEMYQSNRPWPLLDFLDQWKAGRINAPTPSVVQVVCGYRNMVNARGPRAADKQAWVKRVERKPTPVSKPKA